VTGQAAWFDLRVRVRRCAADEAGETEPRFPALKAPPKTETAPRVSSFGAQFRRWREARR
jgi:hypothetical protein